MQIHTLVYCSQAAEGLTRDDLERIAQTAQAFNLRNEITGMLLYSGESFIQVLEGPLPALELLYGKIKEDERHHDVECLMCTPLMRRRFGQWSMGVFDASESAELDRDKLRFICDKAQGDPAAAGRAALTVLNVFRKVLGATGTQHAV